MVSSGAIALGRAVLKLARGPLKLEDLQAAAAVGQIALARIWAETLGQHGITAGQILVTLGDTEERRRYLNARETIDKLLEWKAVPVINENDTVATTEIRYGDNDRLAARVATMMSADLLVLLSDVDGLYDAPPGSKSDAKLVPLVERITPEIEAMAGASGSELSRGGMMTKIEAGKIATSAGTHMVIASGHPDHAAVARSLRRALHLVPDAGQSGHRAQEMDRGLARTERHAVYRCRRGRGFAARQESPARRASSASTANSRAATPSSSAISTAPKSGAGSSPMTPTTPARSSGFRPGGENRSRLRGPRRDRASRRSGHERGRGDELKGLWFRASPFFNLNEV